MSTTGPDTSAVRRALLGDCICGTPKHDFRAIPPSGQLGCPRCGLIPAAEADPASDATVLLYSSDFGGTGYYRMRWAAEILRQQGHRIAVAEVIEVDYDADGVIHRAVLPTQAEAIVLQTPCLLPGFENVITDWRAQGLRVTVECDDAYDAIPAGHASWARNRQTSRGSNHLRMRAAMAAANAVVVSTPILAAGIPGARVVGNYLPDQFYAEPTCSPDAVIGWQGSPLMHVGDLELTGGAVERIVEWNSEASFHHFGSQHELVAKALKLELDTMGTTDWLPATAFAKGYGPISVGIVPLVDNPFNAAKSAIKGIEMMARGIPFVASPSPAYASLHTWMSGLGVEGMRIARRPGQWYDAVRGLCVDPGWRREQSEAVRKLALERLMLRDNAWRFWEAWTSD